MSALKRGIQMMRAGAEAVMGPKGLRLASDPPTQESEQILKRRMRELRSNSRKFETIICHVDRSTGEILIPKKTRGLIAALRREAEHRMLGWIVAVTIAMVALANWGAGDRVRTLSARAAEASLAASSRASRGASTEPSGPHARLASDSSTSTRSSDASASARPSAVATRQVPLESVQTGSIIRHRWTSHGTFVMYTEPVFETRPVSARPTPAVHAHADTRININTATVEELDAKLDGVGPVMARKIVAARPLRSIEDLDNVAGIGPRRLAALRPLVTLN